MSLETRESSTSVKVIQAKGTILHFTIREFALVTGLNSATNKDEFVFDEERPNRIIDQYFDGESFVQKKGLYPAVFDKIWENDNDEDALKFANLYFIHAFLLSAVDTVAIPRLHFDLVKSGRYSDYPWGSVAFEELARSLHKKLKPKGKFYMLLGMPLAIQIWLYECCSNVPRNVASKVDSQIPLILNWKTNSPRPRYETLMGSMFNDTNDKVVFKNIEPTRKEISAFHISKKLVPGSASHNEDDIDSDDDFQDPPQRQNQFTTKKKHHGDFLASPIKKKMKPHSKGVDELISKRSPPLRAAKMCFVRTPIHKTIQTKVTLRGNRKDINRPYSKKFIPIQSPAPSSFSSEDEDGIVSKKAFDKFCEKKQAKGSESDQPPADENVKSTSPHQRTKKFVHEFNKNPEATLVAEEMEGYQSNSMNDVYNEIDGYNEDNDIVLEKTDIDVHEAKDVCDAP
ncbi:hypothetical protein FXO38_36409, partial [Capsicum annuum]